MEFNSKEIQQQYQGFLNTEFLWENSFYGLQQMQFPVMNASVFEGKLTKNPRLGKRVESFVSCYLQQFETVEIIHENIQIQKKNITIGEIDCVLTRDTTPIHLEIIFKYYLYDEAVGSTEIEHWIGPNRNDSLEQKIEKLSAKQLPLLFREETQKYVDIDVATIKQKVFFKAQLFVPYSNQNIVFGQLNADCVQGFYCYQHELLQFSECKFYIPTKINWLLAPQKNVDWLGFGAFKEQTEPLLSAKKSPLCWIKHPNGELSKFFLVFWKA
jgi:hypothetical protein